jgi:lysophospholipase L1-like esterase
LGVGFLALGDSYTIGEGVAVEDRWPAQLAGLLRQRGIRLAAPMIVARTGWTASELAQGIARADLHPPYKLVSLLVGVNDQYRGLDPLAYQDEFRALLVQAVGFAGDQPGRVLVLSIPDWGVTPFAAGRDVQRISAEIETFNLINQSECRSAGGGYIDVTALSRQAGQDADLLAEDGLHPSGKMYAAWADLILPRALAALGY